MAFAVWLMLGWLGAEVDLLSLSVASPGPGAPPGWEVQGVRSPDLAVVDLGPHHTFRLSGAGRAAWVYRDLRQARPAPGSVLRWSWRVLESPPTADLRDPSRDDFPIRVYVVLGNSRALLGQSGKIIFSTFGNGEPEGYEASSHVSRDRIQVIRVEGALERGEWREHRVDPDADYRRIWGRYPPPISAVGVMQDTDQTGVAAVAELRFPTLTSPDPTPGPPLEGGP